MSEGMKKVLVLGARGNLGTCIITEMNRVNKWEVLGWGREECDVLNEAELEQKIVKASPDYIINTVAYNNVDACEDDLNEQRKALLLNVCLVERLAMLCKNINAELIQFSTNYVFDGKKERYTEYDEQIPINFYGLTKYMSERAVSDAMKNGLRACILRVSNLYGPKGEGASSKPSFFQVMEQAADSNDCLKVIDDELSCFTYTKDIAYRLCEMLDREDFVGTYHFVNSTALTWYDAIKQYFSLIDRKVELKTIEGDAFNRKAKRPKTAVLISTRMAPMRSYDEALKAYVQEYLKRC